MTEYLIIVVDRVFVLCQTLTVVIPFVAASYYCVVDKPSFTPKQVWGTVVVSEIVCAILMVLLPVSWM